MTTEKRPLRVAILGVGTVGAEVARGFLHSPNRQIGPAGGRMLELVAIAEMNVQGAVDRGMPREIIVADAASVVRRDDGRHGAKSTETRLVGPAGSVRLRICSSRHYHALRVVSCRA
jgi:homoserine dehydrogenase